MIRKFLLGLLLAVALPASAAITVSGSVVFVDSTANSSSTSVTVPASAEGVAIFWQGIVGSGGLTMSSITLAGNSLTLTVNNPDGASPDFERAHGVGFMQNPTAGSQTFAWDWSGAGTMAEGGVFVLRFFDSGDPMSIRDTDATYALGPSETPTLNVDSTTADYVVGMAFGADSTLLTNQTGQTTDADDHNFNGNNTDLAHVNSPGASTTAFSAELGTGAFIAVSLRETAGGASGLLLRRRRN